MHPPPPLVKREKCLLDTKYLGLDFSNCPPCPNPARNKLIFEILRNLVNWQTGQVSILRIPNNKQTAQTRHYRAVEADIGAWKSSRHQTRQPVCAPRCQNDTYRADILLLSQSVRFHCDSDCEDRRAKISKHADAVVTGSGMVWLRLVMLVGNFYAAFFCTAIWWSRCALVQIRCQGALVADVGLWPDWSILR